MTESKWMRPVVVEGRRPTVEKVEMARKVSPRCFWLYSSEPDSARVVWFHKDQYDHWCDGPGWIQPEFWGTNCAGNWQAFNPDGSPVLVPCTREEALTAAEWREVGASKVMEPEYDGGWCFAVLFGDNLYVDSAKSVYKKAITCGGKAFVRPVNAVGNYDPNGRNQGERR